MFLKTEVHDGKLEKSLPALKAQIQLDLVKAQRSDARYLLLCLGCWPAARAMKPTFSRQDCSIFREAMSPLA